MSNPSLNNPTRCAEAIVDRVGSDIRMAVPIGIGKPILLIDALYRLAEADRRVKLSIFTGLTLTRPRFRNTLERRFVAPLLDRLFATYSEPLYVAALEQGRLPANIAVTEFFLQAGAWLASGAAQRSHAAQFPLGLARELRDKIEPAQQAGADDLRHLGIGPACRDQLLQHAHVARRDVIVEIVARPVPLLR